MAHQVVTEPQERFAGSNENEAPRTPQGGEISPLINGIIHDAKQLLVQQLTLFEVELKNDLRRSMEASIPLVLGLVVLLVALVSLDATASFLLCWLWPQLPLWAGFGIVTLVMAAGGIALAVGGLQKFQSMTPPAEKTVEGLKENLQWKTKT